MSLYRCRYLDRTFNVFEIQGVACENDAEAIVRARRIAQLILGVVDDG
jgi:hypothetical protein